MKQTESCRLVRGTWEVCIEYLHKLCTEQKPGGKIWFFSRLHRHATVILQEYCPADAEDTYRGRLCEQYAN